MHMVRHPQPQAGVPPSAIEHEDDLLAGAGADLARELGQFHLKERDGDTLVARWKNVRPEAGWTKPTR